MKNEEIRKNENNLFLINTEKIREEILARKKEIEIEIKDFENNLMEAKNAEIEIENPDSLPDLIVKRGNTKRLNPRTHRFRNVKIEEGATLKILGNSRQWCIIHCEEEFICSGQIVGRGMPFGSSEINAVTPSNFNLSYSYPTIAMGGRGGNGGDSISRTRNDRNGRTANGGNGAPGTLQYGGGGGGGAAAQFCQMCRRAEVDAGDHAIDYIGGYGGNAGHQAGKGGDGRRANRNRNGALLYIYAKNFDGEGGRVNLRGIDGEGGGDGGRSGEDTYSRSKSGNGGGGGGAPGGDGGVLIVETGNLINKFSRVNINPGNGGPPGSPGNGRGNPGSPGRPGDDGEDGYEDWVI